MAYEYLTSGSVVLGSIFVNLLSPKQESSTNNIRDFPELVDKAKRILKEYGYIDIPMLVNKLNIRPELANLILNDLSRQGLIIKNNE